MLMGIPQLTCNIYDDDKLLRFHFLFTEFSVFDMITIE